MPAPLPDPQPPQQVKGINVMGHVRAECGIGESCRLMAGALDTVGIPFGILNIGIIPARMTDMSWAHKETDQAPYLVNLFHMNGDFMRTAHEFYGHDLFKDRHNIGYFAWELREYPDEWCEGFRYVHEVWVPSNFILDAISRKSPVPVLRIPHAVEFSMEVPYSRSFFGLPEDRFLFLTVFDAHSTLERKNPEAVIDAFKKAFPREDPRVGLVLKINNPNTFPDAVRSYRERIGDYPNIRMIGDYLSREHINMLMNSTDCLVSLHRAEGFGLTMAEAMALGKPVIGTNWSGNTDFMTINNSGIVNYSLVPIGQDIGPYKASQLWADPDVEHAASYMRKMVEDEAWRRRIAFRGQETIRTEFSSRAVGEMVRRRLSRQGLL